MAAPASQREAGHPTHTHPQQHPRERPAIPRAIPPTQHTPTTTPPNTGSPGHRGRAGRAGAADVPSHRRAHEANRLVPERSNLSNSGDTRLVRTRPGQTGTDAHLLPPYARVLNLTDRLCPGRACTAVPRAPSPRLSEPGSQRALARASSDPLRSLSSTTCSSLRRIRRGAQETTSVVRASRVHGEYKDPIEVPHQIQPLTHKLRSGSGANKALPLGEVPES